MDQALIYKLNEFWKALITLNEVLKKSKYDEILRDATIKRFEYVSELAWKTAKEFIFIQLWWEWTWSPKEVFKYLHKINFIDTKITTQLLEIIDDRNQTVHTYNENFIDRLYPKIKWHYGTMKKLFELIRDYN